MPLDLKDMPRPPGDNGRSLHGSANAGWTGSPEGYDFWIGELVAMGIKWFKVLDDAGSSLPLCEKLLAAGIFPIVRIIRRDPPPNDTLEPNPGHIGPSEEATIQQLVAAGVRYFETNNEPNLSAEWKHAAMPADVLEAAKLVALNWLFDARLVLDAGGFPALPALSIGSKMDLMGALVLLGKQDILLEGCWVALHNYCLNRPLDYPDDHVNRSGVPLTQEQYNQGRYTEWAWWNSSQGCVDTSEQINAARSLGRSPTQSILQDHACFREFEYYNTLAMKYLGRSIPILSTEGGYRIGRREDPRYMRVTVEAHRDLTVAMFDFMQRQAPDYYFAATPWLLFESPGSETDAWISGYWARALKNGSDGRNGIPTLPVPGAGAGDRLPVVDAIKAMPNLARRLPGGQPAPPMAPETIFPAVPAPPLPEQEQAKYTVLPGDTLWAIARLFGTTWQAIAVANQLAAPNRIRPGQILVIPTALSNSPTPDSPVVTTAASAHIPDERSAAEPSAPPVPEPTELTLKKDSTDEPWTSPMPTPTLDWDMRLDALNVTLEPAQVSAGQPFWKLVSAEYAGQEESGGKHQVLYIVLDERGRPLVNQRVIQAWPNDRADALTNERGEAAIPIWAPYSPDRGERGAYSAFVDGLPADRVHGLGLPMNRQVSFALKWQRAIG